jgi:hypothetical protein
MSNKKTNVPEVGDIVQLTRRVNYYFNKDDVCRVERINVTPPYNGGSYVLRSALDISRNNRPIYNRTINVIRTDFEVIDVDNGITGIIKAQMDSITKKYDNNIGKLTELLNFYENYENWEEYAADKILECMKGKKDKKKAITKFLTDSKLITVEQLTIDE